MRTRTRTTPPPSKFSWRLTLPDGRVFDIRANTRSEARARVKAVLGLRRKDRLPVGTRGVLLGVEMGAQPA
jgi:hypothetical protein